VAPHERKAVTLAFVCNFLLMGSYYILRPLRDTVATLMGVEPVAAAVHSNLLGHICRLRCLCRPGVADPSVAPAAGYILVLAVQCPAVRAAVSPVSTEPLAGRLLLCVVQRHQSVHDLDILES
jgi:hypothetical protein